MRYTWKRLLLSSFPVGRVLDPALVTLAQQGSWLCEKAQRIMSIVFNKPISSPVLIGREREIATLQSLIDQVKQGHGQMLLLSGEAGIGKSRLLAEGKRQANEQGFLVLQGTCFPSDRSSPYAPLLDLLSSSHTEELLSLSTPNPDPLARELARLSRTPGSRIERTLFAYNRARAGKTPSVRGAHPLLHRLSLPPAGSAHRRGSALER